MSLLLPWALLWLGTIPVLVWLWRYATSTRQIPIASLIPFEHLVRRPLNKRTRLDVNVLFWLQLAVLGFIALALAEPILMGARAKTTVVLLDTSASMGATTGGAAPLQHAKYHLLARIARKGGLERFFLVTTAPVNVLTPEPTSDADQLRQLIQGLSAADLGGSLAVANRIGHALLGEQPDETLVLTDEPVPSGALDQTTVFRSFATPLPNAAIVGLDAHEPLCAPSDAQLVVTVQNFADAPQEVTLSVRHQHRLVATVSRQLEPERRVPISLTLPEESEGLVEVRLSATRDALAVDNRAFLQLRGHDAMPVVVASDSARFVDTIGSWLDACPRIAWKSVHPTESLDGQTDRRTDGQTDEILITDQPELVARWARPAIVFPQDNKEQRLVLTHWLVDSTHPIGRYLEPLDTVAATPGFLAEPRPVGEPILWGVVEGRKVPLIFVTSRNGRRQVNVLLDPTATPTSVPVVLVFLNSLRWLTGSLGLITTGEPVMVGSLAPGPVQVQRPNGAVELRTHDGGLFRYDSTDRVGRYRFVQDRTTVERVVNFLDPVESNTVKRVSTWESFQASAAPSLVHPALGEPKGGVNTLPRHSLVSWLLGLVFVLLLLEWILYSRKGHQESTVHGP